MNLQLFAPATDLGIGERRHPAEHSSSAARHQPSPPTHSNMNARFTIRHLVCSIATVFVPGSALVAIRVLGAS